MMIRFAKKILVFSIPMLVWMAFVILIDPFNRFPGPEIFSYQQREKKIKPINSVMFNMCEYRKNPTPVVFIGDSRTKALPADLYTNLTGENAFNLHSNAAKMNEMTELFWFATRQTQLKTVYFGVNFNLYNQYAFADRVGGTEKMLENPLLYLFDKSVAESCFILTGIKDAKNSEPSMNREQFWDYNIQSKAAHFYSKYQYPNELYQQLDSVSNYCKTHAIQLTFLILPHHEQMRARVQDYGLTEEEARFRRDLAGLSATIDYDYPNEITTNRASFGDPIHYIPAIGALIVQELATDSLQIGLRLSN